MLKKILEVSENLEQDLLKMAEEIEGTFQQSVQPKNHTNVPKKPLMGNLLDKMKTLIPSSGWQYQITLDFLDCIVYILVSFFWIPL